MKQLSLLFWLQLSLGSISIFSQSIVTETFSFTTLDNIKLSGVIELPETGDNLTGAVLIWGNGPHTRDQEISGSPMFRQLSHQLVNKGMAVLRFDKRGFGTSSVSYERSEESYTTNDLKEDVTLALKILQDHPRVNQSTVGCIGHSEGAMIAAMMASEGLINWSVFLAPPAVSGKEVFLEQRRINRVRMGMADSISVAVGKAFEDYVDFIADDYSDDSIHYHLGKRFLLAHGMKDDDERFGKNLVDQVLDGFRNKWYKYFFSVDMQQYLKNIGIPTLVLYGDHDNQVTIDQNLLPCINALKESGNPYYEVNILSDTDHFFLTHHGKRIEEHVLGEMQVSSKLIHTLTSFLEQRQLLRN